ncbi:YceI family protein [Nannocystaceae bacterium ST9]
MPLRSSLLSSMLVVVLSACPKGPSEVTTASEPADLPTSTSTTTTGGSGPASETTDEGEIVEQAPPAEPLPGQELLSADRDHSSVGFAVARATIGHIGHFARFTANLTLQDGKPVALEIVVRTGSVAADQHGLTEHLKGPDFFDVDKFPTATFTAQSIEPMADDDEGTHRVRGTMHLHGVERTLDFPATLEVGPTQVVGSAVLDISAKAFGIDYEGMAAELAEDRVRLEIELMFPRVAG